MSIGHDDPCSCGSGEEYERCCLERSARVGRLVAELEQTVMALGSEIWATERDWCLARIEEFYDGGVEAFGIAGPAERELLDAQLWYLLDCPLPDGETALWRLRRRLAGRPGELLARSELRAWRIQSLDGLGLLSALCPVDGRRARLELARRPLGEPRAGSLVLARSVPLGPQRWTLLGSPCVIDSQAHADFEALLATLDAPLGEFWRVHGGFLAHCAWAWPQQRERTLEGTIVANARVAIAVADVDRLRAVLDADPELDATVPDPQAGFARWRWRWDPPAARELERSAGVRYSLCQEDADPEPYLVDADLDFDRGELWLRAPTPERLDLAQKIMRDRCGALLDDVAYVGIEPAEIVPRWQRCRREDSPRPPAPALAAARRRAA